MKTPANLCGAVVARLRREAGLTQEDLRGRCRTAGWTVARSVLAKVENRSRSVSDLELVALADALGVDVSRLLGTRRRRRHGKS
jgi:transcriptional regulator with XRE-family HTH domain